MSSAGSAIAIVDMDDMPVYVNDALVDMWRFESREAALARQPARLLGRPDRRPSGPRCRRRRSLLVGRVVARRMDGSTFHAQVAVSPVFDSRGRLVRRCCR